MLLCLTNTLELFYNLLKALYWSNRFYLYFLTLSRSLHSVSASSLNINNFIYSKIKASKFSIFLVAPKIGASSFVNLLILAINTCLFLLVYLFLHAKKSAFLEWVCLRDFSLQPQISSFWGSRKICCFLVSKKTF